MGVVHPIKSNQKLACILKASESTKLRMGESLPTHHEDHISGKGDNSLHRYNLAHKFILMSQAMKIPASKAAVDKEWEKLEKISAWILTKVRSKKEVSDEARTMGAKVHFASLMDICHLKNAELEAKHQKYKGRVVLRGDTVKDDSGSSAKFTEQGSSASQMTAAKVMDIISRLLGCAGQAADAVSAYTQVKWRVHRNYWKFPNRNVQTFGFVYHDTNGLRKQKTGVSAPNAEDQRPCSFSCFKPLVGYLISCLMKCLAMLTEGRDGARWPWLPSRPDRALLCLRCTNVLVGQHTVLDCSTGAPAAFPALLSFVSAGHGTNDECAIYWGFRVVGTMVRSAESVQTPFTIELWVIVDPASILSFLESRPVGYPRMERTISWILK